MSSEEKDKDSTPQEPAEETSSSEHNLEDAIHALAPEEDSSDSDEKPGSQDVIQKLSPEEFENPSEDDAVTAPEGKRTPRKSGRGFFDVLVVLVLAGLGVGEYLFVERQKAQQRFLNERFSKIEQSIQALQNRKPSPSAPSAEMKNAIDNLTAQVEGLKGQVDTTRNQQQETVNWVKGEMEKMQSAPPVKEEPAQEEPGEEPQEVEEPEESEPEPQETESHEADDSNPADSFIDFVENLGGIVIGGIKDGIAFVWDKLNDLIDPPPADSHTATPASK
jgi:chaperonin cofactor prefoldin